MKHTKGPWRYSKEYCEVTTSKPGIIEGSKSICSCYNSLKPPEEVIANALLIAAAPDLLAACEAVTELQKKYHGNATDTHIYLDDLCREVLIPAISKAKEPA